MDGSETHRVGGTGLRRAGSGGGARRVLALAGLSVFGVLIVAGLAWLRWLNATPTIAIPTPRVPVPNACDFYIEAGYAVVRVTDVDRATIGTHASQRAGPDGRRPTPATLAEREALLRENAPALDKLRQGFAYEYWEVPARRSWSTPFPHDSRFRDLARVLILEGQTRAERGDWSGAMGSTLDAIQLGEDSARGSGLIGLLRAVALQNMVRWQAWAYLPHLDAIESRKAARRLEAIMDRHFAFADSLQEEKWTSQAGLLEVFRLRDWQRSLGGAASPNWQGIEQRARMLTVSKSQVMANFTAYMDALIANARQPYAAKLPPPPTPRDPISEALVRSFFEMRFTEVRAVTMNRLLMLSLALRAFQAESGRYPERLEELAPRYVGKLPRDEFAPDGALRYRRTSSGYLLYSLGPDGVDDGGTPAVDPNRPRGSPASRFFLPDSVGDIVAGVNY